MPLLLTSNFFAHCVGGGKASVGPLWGVGWGGGYLPMLSSVIIMGDKKKVNHAQPNISIYVYTDLTDGNNMSHDILAMLN